MSHQTISTQKTGDDGTTYTNYSLSYKNTGTGRTYPNIYFFYYPYISGYNYTVSYDIRINKTDNLYYLNMRNARCDNDYATEARVLLWNSVSGENWKHYSLTFPSALTGDKCYLDFEVPMKPNFQIYATIEGGNTGTFDFDIKNIVVYDETDKKYLPSISDGVKAGTTVEIKDTDATVTAVWTPNTYTVHYDITDSETTIPDQTFIFDNPNGDTISTIKPVRKGYTFAGWRYDDTEDSSFFKLFNPGDKIPSGYGDFTLHAMWVANGYHVTFEGNGADSGTMSDEAFTYDDNAKSLTANSFARNGYRFVGWNTKVDGSGQSYSDAQAVKNLSEGGETILVNTDSLQFNQIRNDSNSTSFINTSVKDLNSLTSGVVYSTTVTNTSYESGGVYSLPLDNFTSDFKTFFADKKMNISFKARSDKPMSINKVGFESASGQKQISLNNQWDTYSITAKMNSSINNRHALIFYSAQQTGTYYVGDLNVTMGGEVKLYAQWEPVTYTNAIAHWASGFENNEGNNNRKDSFRLYNTSFTGEYGKTVTYTEKNAVEIPNGLALTDHIGSDSYSDSWKVYPINTSFIQPAKETYAEYYYEPVNYIITYNLNGGTLSKANPSTYNVLYGVDFINEPVRSGYKFLGWYIDGKKVTGINVGCNATFTSTDDLYAKLATRTTGNQTVEAQWGKLTDITITNTVSGNMGNKSKDFIYTLQFPSSFSGTKLTVMDASGNASAVTIGSDCKLSFALKHGQSYTIKELNEVQFDAIKGLTNYGISKASYAEEGYKTSSTTKMDAHGNIQLIFNNQNGSVLPTGIILAGSGMGIIVALVVALGWFIKHKFIH